MSDFFQNGIITTLHDLGSRSSEDLEAEVIRQALSSPVALLLPCLASELEGPALAPLVRQLATIPWLGSIVVGLDQADGATYQQALRLFATLPQPHHVIWNDGPRLSGLVHDLHQAGLAPRDRGKGHNIWLGLGLVQALGQAEVVALHDCDVVNFEPRMLARLVFPVVHQESGYVFAKGFYPRISREVMYGRVTRLFVTPLIRALRRCVPPSRYLEFLDSFRYPLAGECAICASAQPAASICPATGGSRSACSRRCSVITPRASSARWTSPRGTTTSTRCSLSTRTIRIGVWPA